MMTSGGTELHISKLGHINTSWSSKCCSQEKYISNLFLLFAEFIRTSKNKEAIVNYGFLYSLSELEQQFYFNLYKNYSKFNQACVSFQTIDTFHSSKKRNANLINGNFRNVSKMAKFFSLVTKLCKNFQPNIVYIINNFSNYVSGFQCHYPIHSSITWKETLNNITVLKISDSLKTCTRAANFLPHIALCLSQKSVAAYCSKNRKRKFADSNQWYDCSMEVDNHDEEICNTEYWNDLPSPKYAKLSIQKNPCTKTIICIIKQCKNVYKSLSSYLNHLCSVHYEEISICPYCKEDLETDVELYDHLCLHKSDVYNITSDYCFKPDILAFECLICTSVFLDLEIAKHHLNHLHTKSNSDDYLKINILHDCYVLLEHIEPPTKNSPSVQLNNHLKKNKEEDRIGSHPSRYQCGYCYRSSYNLLSLKDHFCDVHRNRNFFTYTLIPDLLKTNFFKCALYKCHLCGIGPGTYNTIKLHWSVVHNSRKFKIKELTQLKLPFDVWNCYYCSHKYFSYSLFSKHSIQWHQGLPENYVKSHFKMLHFGEKNLVEFYNSLKIINIESDCESDLLDEGRSTDSGSASDYDEETKSIKKDYNEKICTPSNEFTRKKNLLSLDNIYVISKIENLNESLKLPVKYMFQLCRCNPKVIVKKLNITVKDN